MKVPPRVMFSGQVVATVWSCFVQVGVLNWAFANIKNICAHDNIQHFTCPNGRVFFNASIIWGLVGPQRIFSSGQIYNGMLYFFLAGALGPPIVYFLTRAFPRVKFLRYINVPLIFGGSGSLPPASTINYTSWAAVGFFFNKFLKNRYRGWWSNYNYVTSAGMDCGLAISTIVIFLTLQMTNTYVSPCFSGWMPDGTLTSRAGISRIGGATTSCSARSTPTMPRSSRPWRTGTLSARQRGR